MDLAPDNMYGADAAAYTIMPTKYTYLLFNWKKDQRARVTFMSPYNGDATTSIDGRTCGNNYFLSINGSVVPKGEPVIYFPVPLMVALIIILIHRLRKMLQNKGGNIILIIHLEH